MNVSKGAVDAIEQTAKDLLRWPNNRKWDSADKDERFRALFGAPSVVIAEFWERIIPMVKKKNISKTFVVGTSLPEDLLY
jgi:hypothetical protein